VPVLFIAVGFGVLVVTFFWIAKLWSRWRATATGPESQDLYRDSQAPDVSDAEIDSVSEQSSMAAMIQGANFGLLLGILACLLFPVLAPMMLILSGSGSFYSARALWQGISRYRILPYRALVGLLLSLTSVGLNFLHLTEGFPASILPPGIWPSWL